MFETLVSLRVPSDKSMKFYKSYYNTYSLLQMNDIILTYIYDSMDPLSREFLMRDTLLNGEDYKQQYVYSIGAGLDNKSLGIRANEKRSINKKLIYDLYVAGKDPVRWYIESNEYMMLYSYTEQAIKIFLEEKNENTKDFREAQILVKMFDVLRTDSKINAFIKKISEKSNSVIEQEDEVRKLWDYFTRLRNLYMHSGGYITKRFSDEIKILEEAISQKIEQVDNKLYYEDDSTIFRFTFKQDEIYIIEERFLNFFRNFSVMIIESLDEIYK